MRDTKERIQSEALRLFAENGYHAVTVEQIGQLLPEPEQEQQPTMEQTM